MRRFMFHEKKFVEAEQEVEGVIKILDLKAGAQILDLPCGVGRHSIPLAKRGFSVTGVDITTEFLNEAKQGAESESLDLQLIHGDMRTFENRFSYDAIVNLYTSFGYFEQRTEDWRVLRNFYSLLRPGGKLLMDLMSKEIFVKNFKSKMQKECEDGSTEICEHEWMSDDWVECKWTSLKNGTRHEVKAGLRLYSSDELGSMLSRAGFAKVQSYGGFDGSEYKGDSGHLVLVAEK